MMYAEEKIGPLEGMEQAVAAQLARELEPQRGRAAAAFLAAVREGRAAQVSPAISMMQAAQRRAMWIWGGLPTALAACVAVAVGLQMFLSQPTGVSPPGGAFNVAPAAMEENLWTRDMDGGVVQGQAGPLHVLRQQVVRQKRWVDPGDGAVYSVTEPGEKVNYETVRPF